MPASHTSCPSPVYPRAFQMRAVRRDARVHVRQLRAQKRVVQPLQRGLRRMEGGSYGHLAVDHLAAKYLRRALHAEIAVAIPGANGAQRGAAPGYGKRPSAHGGCVGSGRPSAPSASLKITVIVPGSVPSSTGVPVTFSSWSYTERPSRWCRSLAQCGAPPRRPGNPARDARKRRVPAPARVPMRPTGGCNPAFRPGTGRTP